jgi:regulator of sigma E protease
MLFWFLFIIGFLITIVFIVGIHEAGHFIAARLAGVKVLRFSIGFGKTLFRFVDKRGTEFVFALIPLGGYVKMLGEMDDEVDENEKHRTYAAQAFYKKMFIILAGPLTNFIGALLLYWIVYSVGFITLKPILGTITPQSIAAKAGLLPYHEITHMDGKITPTWTKVAFQLITHAGDHDSLMVTTKLVCGLPETLAMHCPSTPKETIHRLDLTQWQLNDLKPDPLRSLGIAAYFPPLPLKKIPAAMLKEVKYPVSIAFLQALEQCKELTYFNLRVFAKMLTGKLSLAGLGGPITIFNTAGLAISQGLIVFLTFLAFMNLSIGLINLFPIPGLDGGHLFLQLIEWIRGKPLPPIAIEWILRCGFAFLFFIFLQAMFNDIMRLF